MPCPNHRCQGSPSEAQVPQWSAGCESVCSCMTSKADPSNISNTVSSFVTVWDLRTRGNLHGIVHRANRSPRWSWCTSESSARARPRGYSSFQTRLLAHYLRIRRMKASLHCEILHAPARLSDSLRTKTSKNAAFSPQILPLSIVPRNYIRRVTFVQSLS